jgi:glucose/mannose-6-phosphate isomerase
MLDIATMDKVDRQGMYKIYDRWPQIARESYNSVRDPIDYKDIDHIVFAGMGGSGAIGDLFSSILSKTDVHVTLVKGYVLPKTVDSNTLVIPVSVSGNTAETLSVLESAINLDCKIISFSSGGKLEHFCKKNNLEYRNVKRTHSPRTSFASYVYSILGTLNSIVPIQKSDILESIASLDELSLKINSSNLSETNFSLMLANWISGIPMIYYPHGLQAAAIRFKNSLQENAKMHAMAEDVIESCHNGIVSWEVASNVVPILLRGENDFTKTKERWEILKQYFEQNHIHYKEINSISGNILAKLVCFIYFLDYATIYRAILSNVDPTPVASIDFIKSRLNSTDNFSDRF